jgi:hypothetical protein
MKDITNLKTNINFTKQRCDETARVNRYYIFWQSLMKSEI